MTVQRTFPLIVFCNNFLVLFVSSVRASRVIFLKDFICALKNRISPFFVIGINLAVWTNRLLNVLRPAYSAFLRFCFSHDKSKDAIYKAPREIVSRFSISAKCMVKIIHTFSVHNTVLTDYSFTCINTRLEKGLQL